MSNLFQSTVYIFYVVSYISDYFNTVVVFRQPDARSHESGIIDTNYIVLYNSK